MGRGGDGERDGGGDGEAAGVGGDGADGVGHLVGAAEAVSGAAAGHAWRLRLCSASGAG